MVHLPDGYGRHIVTTFTQESTTHIQRARDHWQSCLHLGSSRLQQRHARHHVPVRQMAVHAPHVADAPDGITLLRYVVPLSGQHHRGTGTVRDPELRAVARDGLPGAVLAVLWTDVPGRGGHVQPAVYESAAQDPGHDAGMGPADLPVHAVRDNRQLGPRVPAQGVRDADAVWRPHGAGPGHDGLDVHVRQLCAPHDQLRLPQPRVPPRHVHRRRAPQLHQPGHHRPRRQMAQRLQLLRPRRRHRPGRACRRPARRRLHLEPVAVVLLHRRRQLSGCVSHVSVPAELVGVCVSECRVRARDHQHREDPAEPGRAVGRLDHDDRLGRLVSLRAGPSRASPREKGGALFRQGRGSRLQAGASGEDGGEDRCGSCGKEV